MIRRTKGDEDGPRIHRTEAKDTYRKYRKNIHELVAEGEEDDPNLLFDEFGLDTEE